MSSIWDFSTNPANNNSSPPNGAPEGWLPSNVNNTLRQIMADIIGANLVVDATGGDSYVCTLNPAPSALQDRMSIRVRFTAGNTTTTPTLNPNTLGAAVITKYGGQALIVGDIASTMIGDLTYIAAGPRWELTNPVPVPGAGAGVTQITFNSPLSGGVVTGVGATGVTANGISNGFLAQMAALTVKGNATAGTANAADLTVAQLKTLLGLLSAAFLDVGTTANKVVQLTGSGKLPAVDGSLLTNLPAGSVSSVGLTMPSEFSVAGSPVTGSSSFTVTKTSQAANTVYAGPTSGGSAAPALRHLVAADMPTVGITSSGTSPVAITITNGLVTSITYAP